MTDFTKTISNRLGVYAGEPTNKWGTMVWGTDKWGWKNTEWTFYKGIFEVFTVDSAVTGKNVWHLITEAFALGTSISRDFPSWISSSFSLSSKITAVNIINNGWFVVAGGETNALNWPKDNFIAVADPISTWTELTSTPTTWVNI
jgi:hypothetical protein